MLRYLLSFALLLIATPAMATDWTTITKADSRVGKSMIFADRDSLAAQDGGGLRVEVVYVLAVDNSGIAAVQSQYEFDCTGNRYRRFWVRTYSADGKMTSDTPSDGEWRAVVADEVTGSISGFICSGRVSAASTPGLGPALPIGYARGQMN